MKKLWRLILGLLYISIPMIFGIGLLDALNTEFTAKHAGLLLFLLGLLGYSLDIIFNADKRFLKQIIKPKKAD
ncbi:hypothetical protein ACNAN0_04865 [Agrilactobacillus fermenti]|uniref:hypothetical protein n=1 Tax=Agrilactobacillus fermenti TaxID=2586909 RepID=UPI001E5DDAD7|nr:hypothetical protein [Agrilactobacillus fermenti]MCD2256916.1 hypothetical protein [Agrilactobacillus fermenti]